MKKEWQEGLIIKMYVFVIKVEEKTVLFRRNVLFPVKL